MSATVEKTFTISFADSDGGDHGPNIPDGPNIPNNPDVPHGPNDPSYPPDPDDPTQPESPTEDDPTPYLEIELDEELNEGKTSFVKLLIRAAESPVTTFCKRMLCRI
jgi:hypothetical protein